VDPILILVVIAAIAGFYLAFNIGANDVANTMGTAVGSGALTIKHAIMLAAVCELLGAILIGDEVTKTIKQGFVNPERFAADPLGFAYGMTAAILATALWLQYATFRGLPVSTTHSIVGAVLGFAIMHGGWWGINFIQLAAIFFSWLVSPLMGAVIAYLYLRFILKVIIDSKDAFGRMKKMAPLMIGSCVTVLSSAFTIRLAKKANFHPSIGVLSALGLGLLVALIFHLMITKLLVPAGRDEVLTLVEKIFARMQFVTGAFLAFAHGSNDVANAIGPASAVVSALQENNVDSETHVPFWLLLLGGIGIVVGLSIFGRKVIDTIGQGITEITPSRGFAAEFSAAITILIGTILGMPLSTTHVLVGAVVGVGFARGLSGIDVVVIRKIGRSWIITMPITAIISMIFCFILRIV
jgi:PiT family inorganic phosphate transporter